MSAMTSAAQILAYEVPKLEHNELPMSHVLYWIITFVVFMALLGVLWMFRNTAAKRNDQMAAAEQGKSVQQHGHKKAGH